MIVVGKYPWNDLVEQQIRHFQQFGFKVSIELHLNCFPEVWVITLSLGYLHYGKAIPKVTEIMTRCKSAKRYLSNVLKGHQILNQQSKYI